MSNKLLQLGLLILAGGFASMAFGLAAQRRDMALKRWPAVPGQVVSSRIGQTTEAQFVAPAHSATPRSEPDYKLNPVWAVQVEYRYQVAGTDFTAYRATSCHLVEQVQAGAPEPGEPLNSVLAQCPAGARVQVHYNPANPAESYLIYLASPGIMPLFKTGGLLIGVGLLIGLAGRLWFR